MSLKRNALWILFSVFVVSAMYFHEGEPLFVSSGPLPYGKTIAWVLFLSFLAYSIYCSSRENLFRTIRSIYPMLWARQIGLDLYFGLAIWVFIIYLNEGSILFVALWLIPVLVFANLSILLYVAMNYDSLVSHFI